MLSAIAGRPNIFRSDRAGQGALQSVRILRWARVGEWCRTARATTRRARSAGSSEPMWN